MVDDRVVTIYCIKEKNSRGKNTPVFIKCILLKCTPQNISLFSLLNSVLFPVHSSEARQIRGGIPSFSSGDCLPLEIRTSVCVFLVRTGPSLIQSGLNKDVLLSCAFSVDHHTDVTIKWVLQQKGGHKKLIFAYNGFTRQVEYKDKRAEMFLAEMPKGNASLLLRTVGVRDAGTYSCSILVSSLLWPTVTLNADVLSLVEGDEHKLVCDISHFYPHDADAQWLQEPMEQGMLPHVVTHVVSSSHRHNSDGTYSFSSYFLLKASLRDNGRRYTCRVEHQSLKHPIKKSLTVKVTGTVFLEETLRNESQHRVWKERTCASDFILRWICASNSRWCFSERWSDSVLPCTLCSHVHLQKLRLVGVENSDLGVLHISCKVEARKRMNARKS
uniref:Ig-like domain-containing protein n=1 Tax=Chelonoidis abingdonii TaxID=106734 RepID=A0A8C0J2V2_CHEAB